MAKDFTLTIDKNLTKALFIITILFLTGMGMSQGGLYTLGAVLTTAIYAQIYGIHLLEQRKEAKKW